MSEAFYVARRSFVIRIGGRDIVVRAGLTHVTGSDPLYLRNPDAFRLLIAADSPVEQATAAPGEKRVTSRGKRA